MTDETFVLGIEIDHSAAEQSFKLLEDSAKRFGSTVTGAFRSAIINGKSFEDTLRGLAMSFAGGALNRGLKPLEGILNGIGGQLFGGLAGIRPFAAGGVAATGAFGGGGGIVAAPTYFPTGSGLGLMGEAGAEAILPLRRAPDGRLGVAAHSASGSPPIVINIATPDVAGFERSQSQISAALARAVARGQRGI